MFSVQYFCDRIFDGGDNTAKILTKSMWTESTILYWRDGGGLGSHPVSNPGSVGTGVGVSEGVEIHRNGAFFAI